MQNNSRGLADTTPHLRRPRAEERAAHVQEAAFRQQLNENPLRASPPVKAFEYGISLSLEMQRAYQNVSDQVRPFAVPISEIGRSTPRAEAGLTPEDAEHRTLSAGERPQPGLMAAFSNTCHRWQLPSESHLTLLGLGDDRSLGGQILYGRIKPPRDVRSRASCVIAISVGLGTLFRENLAAELDWLQTPIARLAGRSPFSFMLDGDYLNLFAVRREVERAQGLA